jgi:hypothetical protein
VQCSLRVRTQLVRGVGGDEPAAGAPEERDAELGLELPHLLGERRLREAQPLGGLTERPRLHRRDEVLELLQGQGKTLGCSRTSRLPHWERTFYHVVMLSLLTLIAILSAVGALAVRYGVDSRRPDGRPNW